MPCGSSKSNLVMKRSRQDSLGELQYLLSELESYERMRDGCPICVCQHPFCTQPNAQYLELTEEEVALIRAHRCAKACQSLPSKCNATGLQHNPGCCSVCGGGRMHHHSVRPNLFNPCSVCKGNPEEDRRT